MYVWFFLLFSISLPYHEGFSSFENNQVPGHFTSSSHNSQYGLSFWSSSSGLSATVTKLWGDMLAWTSHRLSFLRSQVVIVNVTGWSLKGVLDLGELSSSLNYIPKWLCVFQATSLTPCGLQARYLFLPPSLPWEQQQEMALTILLPTSLPGSPIDKLKGHLPKVWTLLVAWFLNSFQLTLNSIVKQAAWICFYNGWLRNATGLQIPPHLLNINYKQKCG